MSEARDRPHIAERGAWLGLVGGPVLWLIHQAGSSVFASYVCGGSWGFLPLHLLTIAAGLATVVCIAASILSGRVREGSDRASPADTEHRRRFMARLGTLIGLTSLLLILLEGVPNFFPELCR